jgi:hypothetical protein
MLSIMKYAVSLSFCASMVLEILSRCPITSVRYPLFLPLYSARVRFDAGGEDCGLFVDVLVVGDVEVGLARQAGCEACAEDAVDPQCGEHCAVVLVQCRSPCGDFDRR